MKIRLAALAATVCLAALPASAQVLSFDPLKDLESAIPRGAPNEARILQARAQVREVAQDALATLYEVSPGSRRVVERSAGYAVFSAHRDGARRHSDRRREEVLPR